MPRKKIRHICEAVELLNERAGEMNYTLVVTVDKGRDDDVIDSYPFVKNYGLVGSSKVTGLYREAALFVQNSCFETFGLAPVEALSCDCPILCSGAVGALEVIGNIRDEDVIRRYDDPEEIAAKIRYLLENPNAERLSAGFDWENHSWKTVSTALVSKLSKLVSEK